MNLSSSRKVSIAVASILLFNAVAVGFVNAIPAPTGYFNDWAYLVYEDYDEDLLEGTLAWIEENTTVEIFIVTTMDLEGETIERYANVLFNQWGIGKSDVDNGLLILVYYDYDTFTYSLRIEVGQGLEGAITDIEASHIAQNNMTPWFEYDYWYEGFYEGLVEFYYQFKDDPSVVSQNPDQVGWQVFAYENPLIAGLFVSVGFIVLGNWALFELVRGRRVIVPLIGIGALILFTAWLDATLWTLGYAIIFAIGGTVFLRGGRRVLPGGGSSEGGGYTY
jgi:uncharacterized membrane protein YgcG